MIVGNDSAYPVTPQNDSTGAVEGGLTKRELFAAMAIQGIAPIQLAYPVPDIAATAVQIADALIEALVKDCK